MKKHDMKKADCNFLSEVNRIFDAKTCYKALGLLKNKVFPFDALICGNDDVAVGALKWLSENNLRVPENVAITGFDNNSFSDFLPIPLASVDRKNTELGAKAYELLSERLKTPGLPHQTIKIPMSFIWRQSAGEK